MSKPNDRTRARQLLARVRKFPASGNLPELYDRLSAIRNVVGSYVGFKTTNGRVTRTPSIVCVVKQKLPEPRIKRADDRIPKKLAWRDVSGTLHEVRTDVVESRQKLKYQSSFAGPGDDVRAASGEFACLGIALAHPTLGRVVTTAAHVLQRTPGIVQFVPSQAPRVRIADFRGGSVTFDASVLKIHLTEQGDYALLQPLGAVPCANLYRDDTVLSRPYFPGPGDLGREVVVLGAVQPRQTTFRGLSARLFNHPAGIRMSNLLITDDVTEAGDSGACLADVERGDLRVWGLLVGSTTIDGRPVSVFSSALAPLLLEQADYLA
jgi:hypothetical protein